MRDLAAGSMRGMGPVTVEAARTAQARAPRDRDPSVIDELDRQTTPALLARAVRLAEWERWNLLSRGVEFAEPAWDQVASVLAQVREGTLTWDPKRCTLLQFLCGVFQARARRTLRLRRESSFDAMLDGENGDGTGEDAERGHATLEEAMTLGREPATPPDVAYDRARVFKRVVTALSELVVLRRDPDVTRAFEAWTQSGAISELEVAQATGLPIARARRAVRILRSFLDDLPAVLRDEIKEVLT
jgi:hypothetical protein